MFVLKLLQAHREALALRNQGRSALEARQRERFRALVAHCARHSRHYREIIAQRRIRPERAEPGDFPVLDKATVAADFDRIATPPGIGRGRVADFVAAHPGPASRLDGRFNVVVSSGTSGQVGHYVHSDEDWARGLAPALRMNPYRGRPRRLAFYGMARGHQAGVSMALTSNRGPLRLAYNARVFDLGEPAEAVAAALDRFQPEILVGYPAALFSLAEAQRAGAIRLRPDTVQCSGESVLPAYRAAIEAAFGRPLYNVYSSAEHLLMGMSPGGGQDMMLYEENFIFEIAADHVLVTNLCNHTLPLIRYRMNDRLVPAPAGPADPWPYRRVKELVGRSDVGNLVFPARGGGEVRIPALAFAEFSPGGAERFQFRIGPRACRLSLVLDRRLPAERSRDAVGDAEARLRALFAGRGLPETEISVAAVAAIPPDPRTGKLQSVVLEG
jgi:phenylacetate-coenzyme A ligase PaaK-like adenylate-forming protein